MHGTRNPGLRSAEFYPILNHAKHAADVPIEEVSEKWNEYKLADGSVIRGRLTVLGAARIPDEYDNEGNPIYIFRSGNVFSVIEAPDNLKRKVQ
jgi:hypothetical protein